MFDYAYITKDVLTKNNVFKGKITNVDRSSILVSSFYSYNQEPIITNNIFDYDLNSNETILVSHEGDFEQEPSLSSLKFSNNLFNMRILNLQAATMSNTYNTIDTSKITVENNLINTNKHNEVILNKTPFILKNKSELGQISTYKDWDFDNYWSLKDGELNLK